MQEGSAISEEIVERLADDCIRENNEYNTEKKTKVLDTSDYSNFESHGEEQLAISLKKIYDIININKLSKDACLELNSKGLNIVYGNNASGKTGYVRILKKIASSCDKRTRIIPNIYQKENNIEAKIDYLIGDKQSSFKLTPNCEKNRQLQYIKIFDNACHYTLLNDKNDIIYTPLELDKLHGLIDLVKRVRNSLDKKITNLKKSLNFPTQSFEFRESKICKKITDVIEKQNKIDLSDFIGFQPDVLKEKEQEKAKIIITKPEDIKNLEIEKTEFEGFLEKINNILETLKEDNLNKIDELLAESQKYSMTLEEWAVNNFKDFCFNNVTNEFWYSLWEKAKNFSENIAYPEENFPVLDTDAKCVLCQQKLDSEAKKRFQKFIELESKRNQNKKSNSTDRLTSLKMKIDKLVLDPSSYKSILQKITIKNDSYGEELVQFYKNARELKNQTMQYIENQNNNRPEMPLNISIEPINDIISRLSNEIAEKKKNNPAEKIEKLEQEINELKAEEWCDRNIVLIEKEMDISTKISEIEKAKKDTDTTAITNKIKDVVTKTAFKIVHKRFKTELRDLGVENISVDLDKPRGQYGTPYYRMKLVNDVRDEEDYNLGDILSEGEQTCISIAGFLAELANNPTKSCVVFDDPVSSLDHTWRDKIATRFVSLSEERQVIIFTHDITFVYYLTNCFENKNLSESILRLYNLKSNSSETGIVSGEPSWSALNVNRRLRLLRKQTQETFSKNNTDPDQTTKIKLIYDSLRATWERAIEEVLLNKTVERFQREVHTQRARYLSDITEKDISILDENMTKCSRLILAHDQSSELNEPIPDKDSVMNDINILTTWCKTIHNRRK